MVRVFQATELEDEAQRVLEEIRTSLEDASFTMRRRRSGDATSEMSEPITREELAARLEAVDARVDARFERIVGEVRAGNAELAGRIEAASAKSLDKWTAITIALAAVALIYAMLAFGGDMFGLGIDAREVARQAAAEAVQQARPSGTPTATDPSKAGS